MSAAIYRVTLHHVASGASVQVDIGQYADLSIAGVEVSTSDDDYGPPEPVAAALCAVAQFDDWGCLTDGLAELGEVLEDAINDRDDRAALEDGEAER